MVDCSLDTLSKRLDKDMRRYFLTRPWHMAMSPLQLAETLSKSEAEGTLRVSGNNRIFLGSEIVLFDKDLREEVKFTLVNPEDSNPDEGKLSFLSLLGIELMGLKAGDELEVRLFGRNMRFVVLRVD